MDKMELEELEWKVRRTVAKSKELGVRVPYYTSCIVRLLAMVRQLQSNLQLSRAATLQAQKRLEEIHHPDKRQTSNVLAHER